MTDLEILIPITRGRDVELQLCLAGIAENAIRSCGVIGLAHDPEIPVPFRSSALQWTVIDFGNVSPIEAVMSTICDRTHAAYVAVLPSTHAIADKGWFGKLQLPFLRVPSCGMVVADEKASPASGAQPYQVMQRGGMPGQLLMAPRQTLAAIARAATKNHLSYGHALLAAATGLGLATWAVPGIRVDIASSVAACAGKESPDACGAG